MRKKLPPHPGYKSYGTYMGVEVWQLCMGGCGYLWWAEVNGHQFECHRREDLRWHIKRQRNKDVEMNLGEWQHD